MVWDRGLLLLLRLLLLLSGRADGVDGNCPTLILDCSPGSPGSPGFPGSPGSLHLLRFFSAPPLVSDSGSRPRSSLLDLLKTTSVTHRERGWGSEVGRPRVRRSVFLHPGVKICPEENLSDVVRSQQAYYQLRVCQEAVWEAFRVFLDRIPGTVEYQRWVQDCQHRPLCISDLAQNFSSSEEHLSLLRRRMARLKDSRTSARGLGSPAATPTPPQPSELHTHPTGPALQEAPPSEQTDTESPDTGLRNSSIREHLTKASGAGAGGGNFTPTLQAPPSRKPRPQNRRYVLTSLLFESIT
ncbi:interphotoreceptor matrix proteoglycan 1-like [Cynoglossus semilaevis]|uniref:interphotoreceptor matrix proteoglycan 1-like n=1 Tax=Cynoglossus semilaevis TaxID=244447 RepID=UPI000D62E964|nr:interphotoreceptor matrix proteoglycan 1-like [Cynoglossus semilaevis]